MSVTQTVDIPAASGEERRLTIDVPREIPAGPVILTFSPVLGGRQAKPPAAPAEAEEIWAWNRAHPEEVKAKLEKLRGSLSPASFGGMDGVGYQRSVRGEWDAG